MATDCYYRTNTYINVDFVKLDSDTKKNFDESLKNVNHMQFSTILQKNFNRSDETIEEEKFYFTPNLIQAKYFSPELIDEGATYNIYRKTPSQKYYNYICSLSDGAESVLDYNVNNKQYYHYMAWLEFINADGNPEYYCYEDRDDNFNLQNLKTSFNRWSICDVEESSEDGIYNKIGSIWLLGLNMQSPEISHNLGITGYDTLGRYGKISMGQKKYDSSSFTCLLGDIEEYISYEIGNHDVQIPFDIYDIKKNSNEKLFNLKNKERYEYTEKINLLNPYAREVEKLEAWKQFCSNGNLKLLRDIKGNSWIVQIIDSPKSTIELNSNVSQTTISFSWQEIEDVTGCSIVDIPKQKN